MVKNGQNCEMLIESWNPGLEEMERKRGNGEIEEKEREARGMKDREKG